MGFCSNGIRLCRRMSNSNTAVALALLSTILGIVVVCCGIILLNCYLFTPNATLCETGLIYFVAELSAFFLTAFVAFCFANDWRMTSVVCACFCAIAFIIYIVSYMNFLWIQTGWLPAISTGHHLEDGFVYTICELTTIIMAIIFVCGCIQCCHADCATVQKELEIIDLENQSANSKRND